MKTAALVVAAPLIWAASDWIVTGDPLHSLHGTAALAEEADRRRSPEQVPYWTAKYFGYALREPLLVGVPIGLGFAWLYRRRRAAASGRRRGGDDGRVRGRPAVRAAADPPLRRDPRRAAHAVLRPRRLRLDAAAARAARATAGWPSAVSPWRCPSPTCRGTSTSCRRVDRRIEVDGRMYADLQVASRGAGRPRRVRALRAADGRRPPPDPVRALLARRRARVGHDRRERGEPDGPDAAAAPPQPVHRPRLQEQHVPADHPAGRLPPDLPQPVLARLRRAGLRSPRRPPSSSRRGPRPRRGRRGTPCRPRRRRSARPTSASGPCRARSPRRTAARSCRARG